MSMMSLTFLTAFLPAVFLLYWAFRKQIPVQNGILLRADLHLLYDADLLGIKPDSHEIVLAESALEDGYDELLERQDRLRLPRERDMWPDEALLDIHYQSFKIQNRVA